MNANKISSLKGIEECSKLVKLLANDNQLADVKALNAARGLSDLRVVTITGNQPLYEETAEDVIQREALIILPRLDRFNAVTVLMEQRVEADAVAKERIAEAEALQKQKEEEEAAAKAEAEANGEDLDDNNNDDEEGSDEE